MIGYSCAQECLPPISELVALGCGPGDFGSEAPFCALEDDCDNAKSKCFESCEQLFPNVDDAPPPEQVDCKISCHEDYGTESACVVQFADWVAQRDEVLRSYRVCLSPCEGRPSRMQCLQDSDDPRCDPVMYARHFGVEMVEACAVSDADFCSLGCDHPQFGFPVFD